MIRWFVTVTFPLPLCCCALALTMQGNVHGKGVWHQRQWYQCSCSWFPCASAASNGSGRLQGAHRKYLSSNTTQVQWGPEHANMPHLCSTRFSRSTNQHRNTATSDICCTGIKHNMPGMHWLRLGKVPYKPTCIHTMVCVYACTYIKVSHLSTWKYYISLGKDSAVLFQIPGCLMCTFLCAKWSAGCQGSHSGDEHDYSKSGAPSTGEHLEQARK